MRQTLYTFTLLFSLYGIAQEHILTIDNDLVADQRVDNAFLIENLSNKYFGLFLENKTLVNGYLYDLDLVPLGKISAEKISKKYKTFLGYTLGEKSIRIFFSNTSNKKIISILFDFKDQSTTRKEYKINLKETNYLSSHNKDGNFYFISLINGKSSLRVIDFDHNGSFKKTEISTYSKEFKNEWLYDNAGDKAGDFRPSFVKIDKEKYHSMYKLISPYKTQETNEGFAFLLNNSQNFTYLINVNSSNLKANIQRFDKSIFKENRKVASNSFILGDNLFQINVTEYAVDLQIRNLDNLAQIIKSHTWSLEELLEIKNSKVRTSDTFPYSFYNEKMKMKLLVNLMAENKIGLSVVKDNNEYILTLGSHFTVNVPGLNAPLAKGVTLDTSSSFSYDIEFDLIFDQDFNHKNRRSDNNILQRVLEHKKKIALPRANLLDQLNGYYIYGNYNIGNHKFYVFKFEK